MTADDWSRFYAVARAAADSPHLWHHGVLVKRALAEIARLRALSTAEPSPAESDVGVICRECGFTVAGAEAAERVRFVTCRRCRVEPSPESAALLDTLVSAARSVGYTQGKYGADTGYNWPLAEARAAVDAHLATLDRSLTDLQRDAERWRFVLPLLGKQLHSRHFADVNGPEMFVQIGDSELRTGSTGDYSDRLVNAAIDAARASLPRAPEDTEEP